MKNIVEQINEIKKEIIMDFMAGSEFGGENIVLHKGEAYGIIDKLEKIEKLVNDALTEEKKNVKT